VLPLQANPKEMVKAELSNNHTAGIGPNHSTMFTLLIELSVIFEQKWIKFELQYSPRRVFAFDVRLPYVLERQELSLNLLLKLVMSLILEKHHVVLEYFPVSLKILEYFLKNLVLNY